MTLLVRFIFIDINTAAQNDWREAIRKYIEVEKRGKERTRHCARSDDL